MEILKSIFIYIGIFVGLPILIGLPSLIKKQITKIKYRNKLKRIAPSIHRFDIDNIQKELHNTKVRFESQKNELRTKFKFKFEKSGRTIDEIINESEKKRKYEKIKKMYWN